MGRKEKIREALAFKDNRYLNANVEIYDANKICRWVNQNIGTIAFVLNCLGKTMPTGFKTFEEWSSYKTFKKTFIRNENLSAQIEVIRSNFDKDIQRNVLRIVGAPGSGRTRLSLESFREISAEILYVDADLCKNLGAIIKCVNYCIRNNKKGTLVIDNCNPEWHKKISKEVKRDGSKINLLTIGYDDHPNKNVLIAQPYTYPNLKNLLQKLFQRPYREHEEFSYISEENIKKIYKFSGGNLKLALKIAEKFNTLETIDLLRLETIIDKIIWKGEPPTEETLEIISGCSLFSKIGLNGDQPHYAYIAKHIVGIAEDKFYKGIQSFIRQKIINQEHGNPNAVISPYILSINLAKKWWLDCSPIKRKKIIIEIANSSYLNIFFEQFSILLTIMPELKKELVESLQHLDFEKNLAILSYVVDSIREFTLNYLHQNIFTNEVKNIEDENQLLYLVTIIYRLLKDGDTFQHIAKSLLDLIIIQRDDDLSLLMESLFFNFFVCPEFNFYDSYLTIEMFIRGNIVLDKYYEFLIKTLSLALMQNAEGLKKAEIYINKIELQYNMLPSRSTISFGIDKPVLDLNKLARTGYYCKCINILIELTKKEDSIKISSKARETLMQIVIDSSFTETLISDKPLEEDDFENILENAHFSTEQRDKLIRHLAEQKGRAEYFYEIRIKAIGLKNDTELFQYIKDIPIENFNDARSLLNVCSILLNNPNNAETKNLLGLYFYEGQGGIKQDYDKAKFYFKKAADKGDIDARYNLGVCYFYGQGVAQNYQKAFQNFKFAADNGCTEARTFLLSNEWKEAAGTCDLGPKVKKDEDPVKRNSGQFKTTSHSNAQLIDKQGYFKSQPRSQGRQLPSPRSLSRPTQAIQLHFPNTSAAQAWLNQDYHGNGKSELHRRDCTLTLRLKGTDLAASTFEDILKDLVAILKHMVRDAGLSETVITRITINASQLTLVLSERRLASALYRTLRQQGFGQPIPIALATPQFT